MPDLRQRQRRPERMDDPDLDERAHRAALRGLARIHAASGTARVLWRELEPLARAATARGEALTVLDVACGGGDLVLALERRARKRGLAVRFEGADLSRMALKVARARAGRAGSAAGFLALDALRAELPGKDVVLSTFFMHHLSEEDAARLLGRMASAARRALVVHDLVRGPAGLALAWFGTRLLSRSPIVHADGPRSVRNAFTAEEARDLAARAGLMGARVRSDLPCRWTLAWRSPDNP